MGRLWSFLTTREGTLTTRTAPKPETRSVTGDTYARAFGVFPSASGQYVSVRLAENLSAVTAAVNAIASGMSSLPALAYRRTGQGRVELTNHWLTRLLKRPNPRMSWPDLIEAVMGDTLARGNALLAIELDGSGRPIGLKPIPWGQVSVRMLPTGRMAYDVTGYPLGGAGQTTRRYLDDEVFHLRDRSDDGGYLGRSRISRAPDVLGNAQSLQDFAGHSWRNQATPSGAIQFKMSLTRDQRDSLRLQLDNRYTGTRNAGNVLILDNDASWQSLSVSPEDAEVLASRRFSVEEIARLFGVSPVIIGDLSHGTFTNSETLIRFFAQSTLTGWCTKFEAEFARSVLGAGNPDLEIVLDLSGLLRGDPAQRWASYDVAVKNNILDTDEIREIEGFNPRPTDTSPAPVEGGAA